MSSMDIFAIMLISALEMLVSSPADCEGGGGGRAFSASITLFKHSRAYLNYIKHCVQLCFDPLNVHTSIFLSFNSKT